MDKPVDQVRRKFVLFSLGVLADSIARFFGLYPYNAPRKGSALAADASSMENLMSAYNREENARKRFLAYADKADSDGYGKVASLFRAAAQSKTIQVRNHATAIQALGGSPKAEAADPNVKTTKENLDAATKHITYGSTDLYPSYLEQAKSERNKDAMKTFNYAKSGETQILQFFRQAEGALDSWKSGQKTFYVCPTCSYTVTKIDFTNCVICFTLGEKYQKVS